MQCLLEFLLLKHIYFPSPYLYMETYLFYNSMLDINTLKLFILFSLATFLRLSCCVGSIFIYSIINPLPPVVLPGKEHNRLSCCPFFFYIFACLQHSPPSPHPRKCCRVLSLTPFCLARWLPPPPPLPGTIVSIKCRVHLQKNWGGARGEKMPVWLWQQDSTHPSQLSW